MIIPAGGSSRRMKTAIPKQFQKLSGKPLFRYSLETLYHHDSIDEVVLVVPEDELKDYGNLSSEFDFLSLVSGGAERWQSVENGFKALSPETGLVLVHDAARPFLSNGLIGRCLEALSQSEVVVPGVPVADTLKSVQANEIDQTIDRSKIISVQTPQGFTRNALEKIFQFQHSTSAITSLTTDEAGIAEAAGMKVCWYKGSEWARKVTVSEDLLWARWVAELIKEKEIDLED